MPTDRLRGFLRGARNTQSPRLVLESESAAGRILGDAVVRGEQARSQREEREKDRAFRSQEAAAARKSREIENAKDRAFRSAEATKNRKLQASLVKERAEIKLAERMRSKQDHYVSLGGTLGEAHPVTQAAKKDMEQMRGQAEGLAAEIFQGDAGPLAGPVLPKPGQEIDLGTRQAENLARIAELNTKIKKEQALGKAAAEARRDPGRHTDAVTNYQRELAKLEVRKSDIEEARKRRAVERANLAKNISEAKQVEIQGRLMNAPAALVKEAKAAAMAGESSQSILPRLSARMEADRRRAEADAKHKGSPSYKIASKDADEIIKTFKARPGKYGQILDPLNDPTKSEMFRTNFGPTRLHRVLYWNNLNPGAFFSSAIEGRLWQEWAKATGNPVPTEGAKKLILAAHPPEIQSGQTRQKGRRNVRPEPG